MPLVPTPETQGAQSIGGVRQQVDVRTPRQSFSLPDLSGVGAGLRAFGEGLHSGAAQANDYFRQVEERRQAAYLVQVQNRVQEYEDQLQRAYRDPSEDGTGVFGLQADAEWFENLREERRQFVEAEILAADTYQSLFPENRLAVEQFLEQREAGFNAANFRWQEAQVASALEAEFTARRQMQLSASINDPSTAEVSMAAGVSAVLQQLVGQQDFALSSDTVQAAVREELESHFAGVVDQLLSGSDPGRAARARAWVEDHQSLTVRYGDQDVTVEVGAALLERANQRIRAATPTRSLSDQAREIAEGFRDEETGQIDLEALNEHILDPDNGYDLALEDALRSQMQQRVNHDRWVEQVTNERLARDVRRLAAEGNNEALEARLSEPGVVAALSTAERQDIAALATTIDTMRMIEGTHVTRPETYADLQQLRASGELGALTLDQLVARVGGGMNPTDFMGVVEAWVADRAGYNAAAQEDLRAQAQRLQDAEALGVGETIAAANVRVEEMRDTLDPVLDEVVPIPAGASARPDAIAQVRMLREAFHSMFAERAAAANEPLTSAAVRDDVYRMLHDNNVFMHEGLERAVPTALMPYLARQPVPTLDQGVREALPTGTELYENSGIEGLEEAPALVTSGMAQFGLAVEPGTQIHSAITNMVVSIAQTEGLPVSSQHVASAAEALSSLVAIDPGNEALSRPELAATTPLSVLHASLTDQASSLLEPGVPVREAEQLTPEHYAPSVLATVHSISDAIGYIAGDQAIVMDLISHQNPELSEAEVLARWREIAARRGQLGVPSSSLVWDTESDLYRAGERGLRLGVLLHALNTDPDRVRELVREGMGFTDE